MSLSYNPFDEFETLPSKTTADCGTNAMTPPRAQPADECCVCYEPMTTGAGGIGKVHTACGHELCVGCFATVTSDYASNARRDRTKAPCPVCRGFMIAQPPAPVPAPAPVPVPVPAPDPFAAPAPAPAQAPAAPQPLMTRFDYPPNSYTPMNRAIKPGHSGLPPRPANYRSWVLINTARHRTVPLPDPVPRIINGTPTRSSFEKCLICNTPWNVGTAGCDIFLQSAYYPTVANRRKCLTHPKEEFACNDCHDLFRHRSMKGAANPNPALYHR